MKNENNLSAADIMQQCKSITLTDDRGIKHGMAAWVTFESCLSDTEYHKVIDSLFDQVKDNLSDTDISVNYRFCNNSIFIIGGESRWMESYGIEFEEDEKWVEFLMDMEVADLPVTSNFAEFMQKMDEIEKSNVDKDFLYPISMTLFKKPNTMEEKNTPLPAPMVLDMDNNPIVGLIFMQELPSEMTMDFSKDDIVQTFGDISIKYNYAGNLSFYCERFKEENIRVSGTFTNEVMEKINENGMVTFLYQVGKRMNEIGLRNIILSEDASSGIPPVNLENLHLSALGYHITELHEYMKVRGTGELGEAMKTVRGAIQE